MTGKELRNIIHQSGLKVSTVAKRSDFSRQYMYDLFALTEVSEKVVEKIKNAIKGSDIGNTDNKSLEQSLKIG